MNERILNLARQVWPDPNTSHTNHVKFAELIVQACVEAVKDTTTSHAYTTYDKGLVDATITKSVKAIKEQFGMSNV